MKIKITCFLDDGHSMSGSVSESQFVSDDVLPGVLPGRLQLVKVTSDDGTREIAWECRGKSTGYFLFGLVT